MARRSVPSDPIVGKVASRAVEKGGESRSAHLVPSGSVMLNLACSNSYRGAWELGRMVNLIGDSSSGKTYLAMEMLAQACRMPFFEDYKLIYDDAEHAMSMDVSGLFGSKLEERLTAPHYDDEDNPVPSHTVEDFHCNFLDALDNGPCLYVLDSLDSLTSEQDEDKIDEMREAREKGKEVSGSYRMAKPKKMSEILQDVTAKLEKTKSFLLIISQTRDNINPMSFEKKTRSGGRALKFYASHEIWLAVTGRIKSKDRIVGSHLQAKVTKNKLTGTYRTVNFDFRHGYGCDDIGSCIDFLVDEKVIAKSTKMSWSEYSGSRAKVIASIVDNNAEKLLFRDAQETWLEIENALKPNRKSKYE